MNNYLKSFIAALTIVLFVSCSNKVKTYLSENNQNKLELYKDQTFVEYFYFKERKGKYFIENDTLYLNYYKYQTIDTCKDLEMNFLKSNIPKDKIRFEFEVEKTEMIEFLGNRMDIFIVINDTNVLYLQPFELYIDTILNIQDFNNISILYKLDNYNLSLYCFKKIDVAGFNYIKTKVEFNRHIQTYNEINQSSEFLISEDSLIKILKYPIQKEVILSRNKKH